MFAIQQRELLKYFKSITAGSEVYAQDAYSPPRWPISRQMCCKWGCLAPRSVCGKVCREQEQLWGCPAGTVETRWVLGTQTLLHILTFCCFPVLHYIAPFVISHQVKALGHFSPVFQQCPDLRCQKMWLLHATVTPWVMNNNNTKDVCLCYSCSSERLFVLFFSLYLLGHKF